MSQEQAYILIVDDISTNIQVLAGMLRTESYEVEAATNGEQALEMVRRRKPMLILLDVMMPVMDGFETCRRLQADATTRDIPVIFLTARVDTGDIVRGLQCGAADYITKPFSSVELLARVRTHLELKRSRDLLKESNRSQRELLHILCHDLSQPFNSMITLMDSLDIYDDIETLKRMLGYIARDAENGLRVIDLVRRMRATEDKEVPLSPVDLDAALGVSRGMLQGIYAAKGIALETGPGEGCTVLAERTSLINSVLNNLLTNAAKFSHPGSTVLVTGERRGDAVVLRIVDRGIGMPPEIAADLFEVSRVTSRPGTAGEKGTGFGMPLVMKFMSAYGGSIEVVSRDETAHPRDHGTEVILTFRGATTHSAGQEVFSRRVSDLD